MEIILILRCLAIANAGKSVFIASTSRASGFFAAKLQFFWYLTIGLSLMATTSRSSVEFYTFSAIF